MISSPFSASANELLLNSKSRCAEYRSLAVGKTHRNDGKISASVRPSEALLSKKYLDRSEPKSSRPWRKMAVCVCLCPDGARMVVASLGTALFVEVFVGASLGAFILRGSAKRALAILGNVFA
jgi:hypothetical protein